MQTIYLEGLEEFSTPELVRVARQKIRSMEKKDQHYIMTPEGRNFVRDLLEVLEERVKGTSEEE